MKNVPEISRIVQGRIRGVPLEELDVPSKISSDKDRNEIFQKKPPREDSFYNALVKGEGKGER